MELINKPVILLLSSLLAAAPLFAAAPPDNKQMPDNYYVCGYGYMHYMAVGTKPGNDSVGWLAIKMEYQPNEGDSPSDYARYHGDNRVIVITDEDKVDYERKMAALKMAFALNTRVRIITDNQLTGPLTRCQGPSRQFDIKVCNDLDCMADTVPASNR